MTEHQIFVLAVLVIAALVSGLAAVLVSKGPKL